MKKSKKVSICILAVSFLIPSFTWNSYAQNADEDNKITITDKQTLYFSLQNEVLENYQEITMPFDNSISGYNVTWKIQENNFNAETTPVYFQNDDAKSVSSITTNFNKTHLYYNGPGKATIEAKACKVTAPSECQPAKSFYVDVKNPELELNKDALQFRYIQELEEVRLLLDGKEAKTWASYYDITWSIEEDEVAKLYDPLNDRFTNILTQGDTSARIQSLKKGTSRVQAKIVNQKNKNIKADAIMDVFVTDILSDMTLFVNNNDVRSEVGSFIPYYTAEKSTQSIQNTSTANGIAVGFKGGNGQVNFDNYRYLIETSIQDETIVTLLPYVKYNGMNIPLEEANKEAQKGQVFYAFKALKPGSTSITFTYGDKRVVSKIRVSEKLNNQIELDPSGEEKESEVVFTVSKDSLLQVNGDERAKVKLNLTKSAIDSMIMSSKETNVKVTIRIPEIVRNQADIEQILISANTMEAARNYKKNIIFAITNESDKVLYSWTFKGSELRQIGYDVDLAIDKQRVMEVYKIDMLAQDTRATILNFHHEGELPGNASVKVYVGDMGYKAKESLFLYYYDDTNKELKDEQKEENGFVVDENLYVELPISHCSSYVLTTKALTEKELNIGGSVVDETTTPATSPDVENKNIPFLTGANTGVISQVIIFLGLMMLGELAYVYSKKKLKSSK